MMEDEVAVNQIVLKPTTGGVVLVALPAGADAPAVELRMDWESVQGLGQLLLQTWRAHLDRQAHMQLGSEEAP